MAQAFAPAFAKAGAKALVLVARDVNKLNKTAEEVKKINPDVETLVVSADIADRGNIHELFDQVNAKYGHADILVNNAGESHRFSLSLSDILWRYGWLIKRKNRSPQSGGDTGDPRP